MVPLEIDKLKTQARSFKDRGEFESAAEIYKQLLEDLPHDPEIMNEFGAVFTSVELYEEAVGWFDKALIIDPDFVAAKLNRGVALRHMEKFEQATASLEEVVAVTPDDVLACFNLGSCLQSLHRDDAALPWLQKACELSPDDVDAACALANTLRALKRNDEAIAAFRRLVALTPGRLDYLIDLAGLLLEERQFEEATSFYKKAVDLDPDHFDARLGLAAAFLGARAYAEALTTFQEALAIQPGSAVAYCNMSLALSGLGRVEEAIAASRKAIFIEPNSAVPAFNMGTMLLNLGNFREGWLAYNYRHAMHGERWLRDEAHAAPWTGEDLNGKSILVLGEQGNGDEIQFCRYVPELWDLGAEVSFLAPQRLHRLFRTLRGDINLISEIPDNSRFDFQCPLMTLPGLFEQMGHPIPNNIPYLAAEPDRVERWKAFVGDEGFKIGIVWRGHIYNDENLRSFPLAALHPVAQVPGVRLISLQFGEGTEELLDLPPGMSVERLGDDFDRGEHGFLDSAAVAGLVDLMITCDTSMCHLAGALGRNLWIALNEPAEWRWQKEREDSIWYPTARLFRQRRPGEWEDVFRRMAEALHRPKTAPHVQSADCAAGKSAPASPRVQVSWGELLDKVSILEIKAERITSAAARGNVRREMKHLRSEVVAVAPTLPIAVQRKRDALRAVNQKLWDLEDTVRACEAESRFGEPFVEAARKIYALNDERSRLKRQINELMQSDFVEEKQHRSQGD